MEMMYLINDMFYLHMQECDEGWDFTVYGKVTRKDIDGGRLDIEDNEVISHAAALEEITSMLGITINTCESIEDFEDLLEELQSNCD